MSACEGGGGPTSSGINDVSNVSSDNSVAMGGRLPKLIELSESISPEVLNIPEGGSVKWTVDGNAINNILNFKFDSIGTHSINAEVISKQGYLLNLLKQVVLVSENIKITTLTASSEGSSYYPPVSG